MLAVVIFVFFEKRIDEKGEIVQYSGIHGH